MMGKSLRSIDNYGDQNMTVLQRIEAPQKPSFALELPEGTTFDEWISIGRQLCVSQQALNWHIGDWWAFGDHRYGARAKLAAEGIFGLEFGTIMSYASVARKYETSIRIEVVSFTHHRIAADLPVEMAVPLLQRAASENLSTRELRREVQALKAANDPGVPADRPAVPDRPERSIADYERDLTEANEAVIELADALRHERDLTEREQAIRSKARNYLTDIYADRRPLPDDFEVIFVEHGRIACEDWYHARRTTVNRWLIECGKPRLIAQRAAFIAHKRAMRKSKVDHDVVAREPKVPTASDDLYPMAKRAAHFLRDPRNGGWIVSRADDGEWWVGNRKRGADDMIAMAERKGFDSIAAKAEIDNAEDHW